jgi:hypothetical protein
VSTLDVTSVALPVDQQRLIAEFNQTGAPIAPGTLDEHLLRVAREHPDRVGGASPRRTQN